MNQPIYETEEEARDRTITRDQAIACLQDHGIDNPADFFKDCGDRASYRGSTILDWLGY